MGPLVPKLLAAGLSLLFVACGGASRSPPSSPTATPVAVSPVTVPSATPLPAHSLRRADVANVLAQGLGSFLQRVELDDRPVLGKDGVFRGFRIRALHDASFWAGVDLRPGDVVTSVNGFPIERPEQAQVAFDSLLVASELRVAYERDGSPREIVYSIVP